MQFQEKKCFLFIHVWKCPYTLNCTCWSSRLVLLFLLLLFLVLLLTYPISYRNKQRFGIKYNYCKQIYKYLSSFNCIYSLACFCFDTNILRKFSCLVCTWFQYRLCKFKWHDKLHLNSHPIKNLLTFVSGWPSEILQFLPSLKLGNSIPST